MTYRNKIVLWAIIVILPLFVLFLVTNNIYYNRLEHQLQTSNEHILKPYLIEAETVLDSIELYVGNKSIDKKLVYGIKSNDSYVYISSLQKLYNSLSDDFSTYPHIYASFICQNKDVFFVSNHYSSIKKRTMFENFISEHCNAYSQNQNPFNDGYQFVEVDNSNFLLITIRYDDIFFGCFVSPSTFLNKINISEIEGLTYLFFTETDEPLSPTTSEDYFIIKQSSEKNFDIVALIDKNVISSTYRFINIMAIIVFLSVGACILSLLLYFKRMFIEPIKDLTTSMRKINEGEFEAVAIPKNSDYEIEQVYTAFNTMTTEIRRLKIDIYEEKLKKQKIQLQTLMLQISPHFFINSLNSIISLARVKKFDDIINLTLCLSKHFRYILYNKTMVTLEDEVEHIKNYLELQGMKYIKEYQYSIEIEDSLYDEYVPILTIQTFIENSLKHYSDQNTELNMRITAESQEDSIHITITDNGKGFDSNLLEHLNADSYEPPETCGIGIYNVKQRYALIYGGKEQIVFSNCAEGGAKVEILIPFYDHMNGGKYKNNA